jgi:hypothetical protein
MMWTNKVHSGNVGVEEDKCHNVQFGEPMAQIKFDLKINGLDSFWIWTKISKSNDFTHMTNSSTCPSHKFIRLAI